MRWDKYVIDASISCPDGLFCFCPIEGELDGEFEVVTGIMEIEEDPPKGSTLVAIWHPDGQEAVEDFCAEHEEVLEALSRRLA